MINSDYSVLYIARHCKTAWNKEQRIQGSKDLPLSEEGIKEAELNLKYLPDLSISRVITSSYIRAYQTAEIYSGFLNIPLLIHKGLRELDHGDWEGEIIPDLLKLNNSVYKQWITDPSSVNIPGGSETIYSAQKRFIDTLKEISFNYPGEKILIVTHKHIRALFFLALKKLPYSSFESQVIDDLRPIEIENELLVQLLNI